MAQTRQDQPAAAPAAKAELNGQAPAAAAGGAQEQPCEDCVATSDKIMGLVAAGFAVALLAVGVDLFTGGALSRWAGVGAQPEG